MINFYQKYISPFYHSLGHAIFGNSFGCRYSPTCSEYAKDAVKKYGYIYGSLLAVARFIYCNPLFPGGHDPVK